MAVFSWGLQVHLRRRERWGSPSHFEVAGASEWLGVSVLAEKMPEPFLGDIRIAAGPFRWRGSQGSCGRRGVASGGVELAVVANASIWESPGASCFRSCWMCFGWRRWSARRV